LLAGWLRNGKAGIKTDHTIHAEKLSMLTFINLNYIGSTSATS